MENHQSHKIREKLELEEEEREAAAAEAKNLHATNVASSTTTLTPSASSSPSHEFSFTISLHASSSSSFSATTTTNNLYNKNAKPQQSPQAIDLTPADDIFFHGHLLPLHLLSSLSLSPRCSSANSVDSFALPIRELIHEEKPNNNHNQSHSSDSCICINCDNTRSKGCSFNSYDYNSKYHKQYDQGVDYTPKGRVKAKSFSFLSLPKKQKDNSTDAKKGGGGEREEKHKRKMKFEVVQFLKRYFGMVRPLMPFKGRRGSIHNNHQTHKTHSFSGNLSPRRDLVGGYGRSRDLTGRRGMFSAPASMRTSPTNSGILVAASSCQNKPLNKNNPPCSSDSTMEELQAAIQAAIAHCKNSISAQEKLNC